MSVNNECLMSPLQSFEDFEELSVVAANNQATSDQENDDTPPPLPPPRSHSLMIAQKPLPTIPNSESVHEDLITCNERDMVNNMVNLEKSKQYEISKDRPLPPLPKESSLDKVHEANSSADSGASSSEDEDLIEENDSDQNEDDSDDEDNSDNIESSVLDDTTITSSSSSAMTSTTATATTTASATATAANSNTSTLESNRGEGGDKSFDANAMLPPVPNGMDSNSNSAGEEAVSSPERGQ